MKFKDELENELTIEFITHDEGINDIKMVMVDGITERKATFWVDLKEVDNIIETLKNMKTQIYGQRVD